ncbi:hypothetical protein JW935_02460 [candidate division KSB1 bacterium]|nr:hypothetical protein [candidate division KSB1 bacterium]
MINKVVISFFFLILIIPNIFAQSNTIYNLSIRDESGAEIGQYFDVQIDSISISSDTTLNFQMIPNLCIQDSTLQIQYTSFLEMLKRNTAKELEAVLEYDAVIGLFDNINRNWGDKIDVCAGYEYNGTHNWVKQVLNEINDGLGKDYFIEVAQPTNTGWNFDYTNVDWKLERNIEKEITFDNLGDPKNCTFKIYGLYKYENDFKNRLRNQIISALFLYNDFDSNLLQSFGFDSVYFEIKEFSQDFLNILNVISLLEKGINWVQYSNEINRSPIANAGSNLNDIKVGELLTLNANLSFDPDSSKLIYKWKQIFASKLQTEYISSRNILITDSLSDQIIIMFDYPGNYRIMLEVKDNEGRINQDYIDIKVFNTTPKQNFIYKGISCFAQYFDKDNLITYIPPIIEKFKNQLNVNYVEIAPYWWMENKNSVNIHPLGEWYPDAPGCTVKDSNLVELLKIIHDNNLKVFLRPHIEFYYWSEWRGNLEPSDWNEWFESYENFILHYASIAEQTEVEFFSVGSELYNSEIFTEKWIHVINEVKNLYNGILTYCGGGFTYGTSHVMFWSDLDYIGVNMYPVITGSNGYYDSGIPPELDPSIETFRDQINNHLDSIEFPDYQNFNKPIIITETGILNHDGSNQRLYDQFQWFGKPLDNREQADYFDAFYESISNKEWIHGFFAFTYKLMSDYQYQASSHDTPIGWEIRNRPAEQVLKYWYKQ